MSQTIKQFAQTLKDSKNEEFRKRNPQVFGSAVGAVATRVGEQGQVAALVKDPPRQPRRKGGLAVVVTIIACRNRLCDDDNSGMGGGKALRDAIARSLAIDDGSPRIRFEYAQAHTTGTEGCIVKLEHL